MITDIVKLSKIVRKCTGNKWYDASYSGVTFKYRFVSLCNPEYYSGGLYSIKVNVEVKIENSYSHSSYHRSVEARENRAIRTMFYYDDNTELQDMLKFFGIDSRNFKINSIKRKK